MSIQRFSAKTSEVITVGEKFLSIDFELVSPNHISFEAGQYILLEVPGIDQKKSYSIASEPEIDHKIELLIDIIPNGRGSTYLASLKPGDQITFLAPAGRFTVEKQTTEIGKSEENLVFVATGSGIAPIRSMIFDLLQSHQDKRNITLFWGLRTENNMFWQEDFRLLSEAYPNFSFHPVLSQSSDEWPMCRGRVTDCLSIHPFIEKAGYYLCGSGNMIKDVSNLLLSKSVLKEHIHTEEFV